MKGFSGFPDKCDLERVPTLFFSELLPAIDHMAELKVTLYCFWALPRKEGKYRYVTRADFANDSMFMSGLGARAGAVLDDALERAVARGTLLHVRVEDRDDLYFMNTRRGRAAVDAIEQGRWRPAEEAGSPVELALDVSRPNIFVLYEQNIGPLTPMIADQLRDIEAHYSEAWIKEAIGLAVANNARSLAYFRAILQRWQTEGKDEGKDRGRYRGDTETDRRRYFEGEYADDIKR